MNSVWTIRAVAIGLLTNCALTFSAAAGAPVPAPAAGVFGPVGLGVALVGYAGYRLWRSRRG